jgi:polyisoprenoid-binding protein YceI
MLRIPGVIGLLQSGASDGPSFVAPMIISESTSAKSAGDGKWTLHGNLTLRGQTKPVTVQVTLKGKSLLWGGHREADRFRHQAAG